MEPWQREHIKLNLPSLLQSTTINQIVLITLRAERILSQADIDDLEEEEKKNGIASQILKFYAILQAQGNNAYDTLIQALRNSSQYEAAAILERGGPFVLSPPPSAQEKKIIFNYPEENTSFNEKLKDFAFNGQNKKPAFIIQEEQELPLKIENMTGGMEKWQCKHITCNLDILVDSTTLEAAFYAQLIGKGLLNTKDILALEMELNPGRKTQKFYEIMQTKENDAYGKLIEAMDQCGMTGATAVLKKAKNSVLY